MTALTVNVQAQKFNKHNYTNSLKINIKKRTKSTIPQLHHAETAPEQARKFNKHNLYQQLKQNKKY